ncbi:hypothetical protein V6N13_067444 [Hibiscus sabdariffa]
MVAQREKLQEFLSLSSRELISGSAAIVGSPVNSQSKWGFCNGKPDWAVNADGLGKHCRSSFELAMVSGEGSSMNSDPVDNAALGAWLEQMQLEQLVAQQN